MNNTFLYIITVLIWGSTWIAINYQLGGVEPEVSIVYRFGLAAIILFTYCKFKGLTLQFSLRHHLQFFLFGITLFSFNYYFLYSAQQHINSALTCIAFSMIMFFNVFNARIWYGTKITQQVYVGGALGLLGIVTLFWPQISDTQLGPETLLGLGLCIMGTLIASTGNMLSMKNQQMKLPLIPAMAWGMAYGAIFMAVVVVIQGKNFNFDYTFPYVSSLLYLTIFGSVIAFASYLTLLNNIGAHKASYASIMFPAVAVIISTIVEGFAWSTYTFAGLFFILAGNLVVLIRTKKPLPNDNLTQAHDYKTEQPNIEHTNMKAQRL
ncbi:EamA family transporter [Colwellia sp. PAMC 21821]|uniref:DMT family transporter n=1 Tax=Colwellia sp. PAMC 21821 TaxID=1816219 RepID=UPI0009C06774|nr:EamA family transporter [Colwellia sp. PAMC 21821]